ncbi:BMC domain-containing protein [Lentibacillus salinarum]|uniref:BMC domain-containing protein n=1 Tax=Lentibacillus salinarum TaxID=446820 RepID=A0ABW3ZQK1_9BACI
MIALGLIETVGYTTAVSAADAAVKAADVEIIGLEKVIGVSGYVGVTVHLGGDVAAVNSSVEAGKNQAETVGEVISTDVIANAHSNVSEKLLSKFSLEKEKPDKTKAKDTTKKERKGKSSEIQPKSEQPKSEEKDSDLTTKTKTSSSSKTESQNRKNDNGKKA